MSCQTFEKILYCRLEYKKSWSCSNSDLQQLYVLGRGFELDIYETFAHVYDLFMDGEYYDEALIAIEEILKMYHSKAETILDLACGTGLLTAKLAQKGYDMIGIDSSDAMLNEAMRKAEEQGLNILYLQQDMRAFELYGTVDVIVCSCDSINYLLESEDVLETFRLVNNYLHPSGLFLFDLNTEYKFKHVLADHSYGEVKENAAYIWENYYDEDEKINEFATTFFTKGSHSEQYRKSQEFHYERAYSVDEVKSLLNKAGLTFVNMYDMSLQSPKEDTERILFVAREKGK